MRKFVSWAASAVLVLGGVAVAQGPTQAAPVGAAPAASADPRPPARNAAWERAAKSLKAQGYQRAPKWLPDAASKAGKGVLPNVEGFAKRPGVVAPVPPSNLPVYRGYNIVKQALTAGQVGAKADITIADPYLNYGSDWHSLMEVALQDGNGNTVEVGWTVNPVLCPSEPAGTNPCVFTYHWEGGVGQGYNVGTGFVPSPTADYAPGDQLPNVNDSSGINFRLLKTSDAIWAAAGVPTSPGYYMGYWPLTEWTDPGTDATAPFVQPSLVQMFTEIATVEVPNSSGAPTPCSDWGNGYLPSSPNGGTQAARIVNVGILSNGGSTSTNGTPSWENQPTAINGAATVYPMQTPATNNFRVGGPGFRSNNTLPGYRDGCGTS